MHAELSFQPITYANDLSKCPAELLDIAPCTVPELMTTHTHHTPQLCHISSRSFGVVLKWLLLLL